MMRFNVALLVVGAASEPCHNWCTRWTCGEPLCAGCDDASICTSAEPHPMCSHREQRHCGAPRCEPWCTSLQHCTHEVLTRFCRGCSICAETQASPFPEASPDPLADFETIVEDGSSPSSDQPEYEHPACDPLALERRNQEIQTEIDVQMARNRAIQQCMSPDDAIPWLPPATPAAPPRPPAAPSPCIQPQQQCGGVSFSGPSACCASEDGAQNECRRFNEYFASCQRL